MHDLENVKLVAEGERDRLNLEKKQFIDFKKNLLKDIERTEGEVIKNQRQMEELANDTIPSHESDLNALKE